MLLGSVLAAGYLISLVWPSPEPYPFLVDSGARTTNRAKASKAPDAYDIIAYLRGLSPRSN